MAVSSNTVIHFTQSKDSLKGILREGFKVFYCREEVFFENSKGPMAYAVPMVSFCDIPLSEVKNHISKYGGYGIGLTKEWANEKGLNPVLYVAHGSHIANSYWRAYSDHVLGPEPGDAVKKKPVADVLRYIKNYSGQLSRGGTFDKDYRFYDEREWRYVVPHSEDVPMFVLDQAYRTDEQKETENQKLESFRLEFTPNDIKYLIIQSDAEIPEFIETMRSASGKFPLLDVERLMTRLITTEQITNDF
ncbi:MAG: abortive infection system antitoxin AbiGi family protein [Flavobacteriales bacterium]